MTDNLRNLDAEAIMRTVAEVIDALFATDREDGFMVRRDDLAGSCEEVSVSIAAVLADRGLGEWTFVQASQPDELNGHAWLEWIEAGSVIFSIDATLKQFAGYSSFVGWGQTPAAEQFTVINYRGPVQRWEWFDTGTMPFTRLIAAVREQLSSRGQ